MDEAEQAEKIAALQLENKRLWIAINNAAKHLRGDIRAHTLNEAIASINMVLPKMERILEVAWGVASHRELQQQVRDLCHMISDPEYAAFLTRRIDADKPLDSMKRQRLGGFPV